MDTTELKTTLINKEQSILMTEIIAYAVALQVEKSFNIIPIELRRNKELTFQVLQDIQGEGFNFWEF